MAHHVLDSEHAFFTAVGPGHHREKIYPYDVSGATITIAAGNTVWGVPKCIIPPDAIIDNYGHPGAATAIEYIITGFYLQLGTASKNTTWNVFRIVKASVEDLNGDSGDAQGGNQEKIYIADTSGFLVGDYVWVMDTDTADGELMIIGTITTNTSLNCTGNMANDYTQAQDAKVYLARRSGVGNDQYRSIWGLVAVASTKEIIKDTHHAGRFMAAGDGLVARALGHDGAVDVLMTIVYDD